MGNQRITDNSSSTVLEIRELSFDHSGPFDLTLQPGECVGLGGPSGSGKTRLLRCIADLDVHRGRMWLAGVASTAVPPPSWRRQVALLPAESAWWYDEVGEHFVEAPTPAFLGQLGFTESVMTWRVDRLSSGEKQRLAVLRMLALRPRVLLLDEPTANLDEDNIARMEVLIRDYMRAAHAASIWVSHDRHQLRRVAGRLYGFEQGRLVEEAGP